MFSIAQLTSVCSEAAVKALEKSKISSKLPIKLVEQPFLCHLP